MDQNTKDVLLLAIPLVGSLATGLISAWVAVKMAEMKVEVREVAKAVNGRMEEMILNAKLLGGHEAMVQSKAEVKEDAAQLLKTAAEAAKDLRKVK